METIDQIKIDEGGYQAEIYLCSEGKLTWLYGRNISDRPITQSEWSELERFLSNKRSMESWAKYLFNTEIDYLCGSFLMHNFDIDMVPHEVGTIILNMSYNMGMTKFNPLKWPNFFKAISEQDWKQAATEGRDSKWFHQVGQRSVRLMNSLENIT